MECAYNLLPAFLPTPCLAHPKTLFQSPHGLHPPPGYRERTLADTRGRSPGTGPGAFASREYRCAAATAAAGLPGTPGRCGEPQPHEPARGATSAPAPASPAPTAPPSSRSSGNRRTRPNPARGPRAGPNAGAAMLSREPCDPLSHVAPPSLRGGAEALADRKWTGVTLPPGTSCLVRSSLALVT